MDISPPVIALIGTVFGGAGLKGLEFFLSRSATKDQGAQQIRDELRLEIERLRKDLEGQKAEIATAEKEMDEWKNKYWELRAEYNKQQAELLSVLLKLKDRAFEDSESTGESKKYDQEVVDSRHAEDNGKESSPEA